MSVQSPADVMEHCKNPLNPGLAKFIAKVKIDMLI